MLFELEIPEWANYISQDADGAWYAWQKRPAPDMSFGIWDQPMVKTSPARQNSRRVELVFVGQLPIDWTQELYKIVWEVE